MAKEKTFYLVITYSSCSSAGVEVKLFDNEDKADEHCEYLKEEYENEEDVKVTVQPAWL